MLQVNCFDCLLNRIIYLTKKYCEKMHELDKVYNKNKKVSSCVLADRF